MTRPAAMNGEGVHPAARMTREEWLAKQLAAAPPLTEAQQAALRRLLRPVRRKSA